MYMGMLPALSLNIKIEDHAKEPPALEQNPLSALECPKFIAAAAVMATVLDLYSAAMLDGADSSVASEVLLGGADWAADWCPHPLKQRAAAQNDACAAQQPS